MSLCGIIRSYVELHVILMHYCPKKTCNIHASKGQTASSSWKKKCDLVFVDPIFVDSQLIDLEWIQNSSDMSIQKLRKVEDQHRRSGDC